MKHSTCLIMAIFLVLLLTGCSQPTLTPAPEQPAVLPTPAPVQPTPAPVDPAPTPAPVDDSWTKVQQAGVLRVGTTADYPPFEYYNQNFELDGFDIALIKQIGQRLGVQVELNDFAFDGLPQTVAIGQVDVAIGALSVTAERQAVANFSNVYYSGSDAVLARPGADPKSLQNPNALAKARLGVEVNSVYQTYAQDKLIDAGLMPKQNLYVYTDISQAVSDLKASRLDAVWIDLKPAESFVNTGGVKILAQNLNQQLYAIGMLKSANALRDKINEALTQLQNDGTLANLQGQYLGVKPDNVVPPQPPPPPSVCMDSSQWVADLSYDDKNMKSPPTLKPGEPFTKGWRILNNGTCTWKTSYALVYVSGNVPEAQMGGQPVAVTREVKPGETFDFQVNLIAPIKAGTFQGFWNMRNAQNQLFGETVWVGIKVPQSNPSPPPPTQTPEPGIVFESNTTKITAGEAVQFKWKTEKAKAAYFFHDGQKWSDHQVPLDGKATEYPPYTVNYNLRVVQKNDQVVLRTITIHVKEAQNAPVIEYMSATPPQIQLGGCVSIDWSAKGQINKVILLADNKPVWDGAPVKGHFQDCPTKPEPRYYMLQAAGPGGTAVQQITVNVTALKPTEPPIVPTEPPVTPEPIIPTEPPVTVVPFVPTEPPVTPEPTVEPTPEPIPVVEPAQIQNFDVSPGKIETGQCVMASWTTGGGTTRVQLMRNGAVILDNTQLNNSVQDCPPADGASAISYTLMAYNNLDQFDAREVTVKVLSPPAPPPPTEPPPAPPTEPPAPPPIEPPTEPPPPPPEIPTPMTPPNPGAVLLSRQKTAI